MKGREEALELVNRQNWQFGEADNWAAACFISHIV